MPGTSRPWRRVGAQARYGEGRRAGKDATWPEHSAYLLRGDVPRSTPIPRNSSPRCIDGPSPAHVLRTEWLGQDRVRSGRSYRPVRRFTGWLRLLGDRYRAVPWL